MAINRREVARILIESSGDNLTLALDALATGMYDPQDLSAILTKTLASNRAICAILRQL